MHKPIGILKRNSTMIIASAIAKSKNIFKLKTSLKILRANFIKNFFAVNKKRRQHFCVDAENFYRTELFLFVEEFKSAASGVEHQPVNFNVFGDKRIFAQLADDFHDVFFGLLETVRPLD